MYPEIILTILATVFVCIGIHETTREGMIFQKPANFLNDFIPDFWMKPICDCLTCMASLWGSIAYWIGPIDHEIWYIYWPVFILVVAGLNATYGNIFYAEKE